MIPVRQGDPCGQPRSANVRQRVGIHGEVRPGIGHEEIVQRILHLFLWAATREGGQFGAKSKALLFGQRMLAADGTGGGCGCFHGEDSPLAAAPLGQKSDGRLEPSRCVNNDGYSDDGYDGGGGHGSVVEAEGTCRAVQVHVDARTKSKRLPPVKTRFASLQFASLRCANVDSPLFPARITDHFFVSVFFASFRTGLGSRLSVRS